MNFPYRVRRIGALSSSRLPEDIGGGYGKIRSEYIHGVASIFPHTYIHFPSTSPMRYIASLRDDVGDPEFAFPRKIRLGRERGSEREARIEVVLGGLRGDKGRGGRKFLLALFPTTREVTV